MPRFRYKAANVAGDVLEGELEASNREAAVKRLQALGHIPIRADEVAAAPQKAQVRQPLFRPRKVSRADVAFLTLELATLLDSGLPLDKALEVLGGHTDSAPLRELLSSLQKEVRGGADLSAAMESHPGAFSPFYVNMVRAGEAGGALGAALGRLAEFMEHSRELRDTVSSALIYPVILLVLAGVSVTVLLAFVVPRFADMFAEAGQTLPWPTRVVLTAGHLLQNYGWLLALVIVGGVFLARQQLRDPATRLRWDGFMLQVYLIGDLVRKMETARFARTLGTLVANGVPLLTAVSISREIIGNRVMNQAVGGIANSIREGQGIARPFADAKVFPRMASQLLQVGEETGNLERMLLRLADIYEREVRTSVRRLVALLEPALIVGLGLLIAGIILSILVAILRVNELVF